jgi:uncharacterized protein VirK/YbjX
MSFSLSNPLLFAGAHSSFPGYSPRELRNKLRFMQSGWKHKAELNAFFRRSEHAALAREITQRPEILGFTLWPYLHAGWGVMQRFEALSQHQQALQSDMAAVAVTGSTESVVIADMNAVSKGLKLVVDRAPWCFREGSLVFNQFLHDERLMSIAFSFGVQHGERVVYVGSVQGANVDSALAKYREIAKDLQGMRSRDFLIKAFQFLTYHLGVKKVLCVSEAQRHHRHPYFGDKGGVLHLNYDEIWQENNGVATDDGFHQLGSLPHVRPMEDIAAKNRALYRRRYALMDELLADIGLRYGPATHPAAPELASPHLFQPQQSPSP